MSRLANLFIDKKNEEESDTLEKKEFQAYRILFVDDEKNVLKAMRRIFRKENYKLYFAVSAKEALSILSKDPIHVVISDHRMPEMTGAELLKEVKKQYPKTIRIMLTAHADINAIMTAVNEGAVYKFITKPWNEDDLRLTVSLALEQYDLIKENKSLKKAHTAQQQKINHLNRFAFADRGQLGKLLVKKKIISKEELDKALSIQTKNNKLLVQILIDMSFTDEKVIIKQIQNEFNIDLVYPNEFNVPHALTILIPREICEKYILVPLKKEHGRLIVAMADPTDFSKVDELKFIAGVPVQPVLAAQSDIFEKIRKLYGDNSSLEQFFQEVDICDPTENIEIILDETDEEIDIKELLADKDKPSAIRIVNFILSDGLRHKASDIHIEPKTKYIIVRNRIDGLLFDKMHIPVNMHPAIVSRIKVMSELDIAERRKPQDGRVTVKTSSRMVDMRISIIPTINGEKIVLRILDRNAAIKNLDKLGLLEKDLKKIHKFAKQPQGIILITGPTGSGKTTTLYSLLRQTATINKNLTTIEDPVEYFMDMAEQIHIREKIGLSFSVMLRAIMRQDPDIIMLGEIRDYDTAEVVFHAALTGHLVLSTLHTNNSIASITRLLDIGIKPYVISDALIGVIAQRLVRKICPKCITNDYPSEKIIASLRINKSNQTIVPKKGSGCEYCNKTGYNGRIGIYEIFRIDKNIKKLIHQNAGESKLIKTAKASGMTTLLDDAVLKIGRGITTCEEVLRVLGPQDLDTFKCPDCNTFLEEQFPYCPFCGFPIQITCSKCAKPLSDKWNMCPYCGEKVHTTFKGKREKTLL